MFHNKTDILLFLLYIGILIFAEKITDHHHAYNRRSEITHMNLVTCNGTAKVWRSASKNLSYISIFTCRILKTHFRNYTLVSKFFNLSEVLFIGIILFYIDIDRQKFRIYRRDNLFRVVKEYRDVNLLVSEISNKYFSKCESKEIKMMGLALNGLGSAYSLPP